METSKKEGQGLLRHRILIHLSGKLKGLVEHRLWLKVLIGMALGVLAGYLTSPYAGFLTRESSALLNEWLALPGTIFIKVIQMVVIPLIFASIIRGIASSGSISRLERTGFFVASYFVFTTTIAILIGITLAVVIQPGNYVHVDLTDAQQSEINDNDMEMPTVKEMPNMISSLLPSNIFGSALNGDMLRIVIFSIIIGITLMKVSIREAQMLLDLLGAIQKVCMEVVKWTIKLVPIAVFGMMSKLVSQTGFETLKGIGVYVITVLLGLFLLIVFYSTMILLAAKKNPLHFLANIRDVQLLAFSMSSSAAAMPMTMKVAEEKLGVRQGVSQFLIPIGATINMDGTALYQAVATVFLAQVYGVEFGLGGLLLLIVTIVGASIGAPAVPGVGIIILGLLLTNMGLPVSAVALVLGVDRILDMTRTAVNVTGDLTAAVVVDSHIKKA